MTSAATASALVQPVSEMTMDAAITASAPRVSLATSRNAARRLKLALRRSAEHEERRHVADEREDAEVEQRARGDRAPER